MSIHQYKHTGISIFQQFRRYLLYDENK